MLTDFHSIRDYFKFSSAREFWNSEADQGQFDYRKNFVEKTGDFLIKPVFKSTDGILKNIREPLMVVAATATAVAITTLAIYPEECAEFVINYIPVATLFKPWMFKLGMYVATEGTIIGVGLRTLGRLTNADLMRAWRADQVTPIPLGSIVYRV